MITMIFAVQKAVNNNGNKVVLSSTVFTDRLDSLYKNASEVSPMVI